MNSHCKGCSCKKKQRKYKKGLEKDSREKMCLLTLDVKPHIKDHISKERIL